MDNFTMMTMKFIESSKMNVHIPSFEDIELGEGSNIQRIGGSTSSNLKSVNLDEHFLIQSIVFFTLLDNYITLKNSNLADKTFRQKYKRFSPNDIEGKIVKELYKILKVIRNSVVHTRNIASAESGISIAYVYQQKNNGITNTTNFALECSKYGLELIYSCILALFNDEFPTKYHKEKCLVAMYRDILNEIKKFQDDLGTPDTSIIPPNLKYKWRKRKYVINPKFSIKNEVLSIEYFETSLDSCDYLISYSGNDYLIPEEEILENREFFLDRINVFKTK